MNHLTIQWSVGSVYFDGTCTMSGYFSGVQAKCKEKNETILYVN